MIDLDSLQPGFYSIRKASDEFKSDAQICKITLNQETGKKILNIYNPDINGFVPLEKIGNDSILEKVDFSNIS